MPRGPKGNLAVLGQTLHFDVGQPLPILPQLRTCHCTVLTDVLCQNPTFPEGQLFTDTVEKVLSGLRTKFFSPAGASHDAAT